MQEGCEWDLWDDDFAGGAGGSDDVRASGEGSGIGGAGIGFHAEQTASGVVDTQVVERLFGIDGEHAAIGVGLERIGLRLGGVDAVSRALEVIAYATILGHVQTHGQALVKRLTHARVDIHQVPLNEVSRFALKSE